MKTENIAYACVTKNVENGNSDFPILRWIEKDLTAQDYTFGYFENTSNQLASVLNRLGVKPGDTVSVFVPRSELLISSFFAILKLQAVSCILFGTLGEEGLLDRLANNNSKIVLTRKSLLRKVVALKDKLPALEHILVADIAQHLNEFVLSLPQLITEAASDFQFLHQVESETPAFLQYTSGSTGKPKGVLHVHGALQDMQQSFSEIMQLEDDDLYWCTADPAWITGLVYGIIAPFSSGVKQLQYNGTYNADHWLQVLTREKVTVWYTAPTALRMLMQEEHARFQGLDFSNLKRMYSVGEPLNPEIYHWCKKIFNVEVYDNWWQSETGSMMIANRPPIAVKPGSMGIPRTGAAPLICSESMDILPPGEQGLLCLQPGWGSMFRNYFRDDAAYAAKFKNGVYITGDLAYQDEEGYFWYISRADDVINTAGHLVGPFEVESALLEIPEIADVAVIGADDPLLHKKIIAFVKLHENNSWSRELELKCRIHVSNKVSTTAIPAEFQLIDNVPKNQSGKILRRVLKAIYEGKDPGDITTME